MPIARVARLTAYVARPRHLAVLTTLSLLGGLATLGLAPAHGNVATTPKGTAPMTSADAAESAGPPEWQDNGVRQADAVPSLDGTVGAQGVQASDDTTIVQGPKRPVAAPGPTTTTAIKPPTTTTTKPPATTTTTKPVGTITTTTAPATTPPPPTAVKPQVSGVCDRQHIARPAYLGVVNCFVVQADWSALQPTRGGPVAANNVIDQAIAEADRQNAADPNLHLRLKLRVYAGLAAPDWAKQLDGPPVTLRDPQTGAVIGTVPRFWTAAFSADYDDLMSQLAARYDDAPVLLEVAVSRCTTQFAEPFLRQANNADNRAAYAAAGYTTAADEACERAQLDTHARLWRHTRTGVAFSPFQSFDAGGVHQDEAFIEDMMVYCRSVLGSRCVLGNNTISWPLSDGNYTSMYQKIASLGGPIYFQTATAAKIGDWKATLDWAAGLGAGMVELPAGYDPNYPLADLSGCDARLEANRAL